MLLYKVILLSYKIGPRSYPDILSFDLMLVYNIVNRAADPKMVYTKDAKFDYLYLS